MAPSAPENPKGDEPAGGGRGRAAERLAGEARREGPARPSEESSPAMPSEARSQRGHQEAAALPPDETPEELLAIIRELVAILHRQGHAT